MSKVLVTGGAGFIASHVVDRFIDAGYEVLVVDNLFSGKRENLREGVPFYEYDIRSKEAADLIRQEKPDILVHAAAQMSVPDSVRDPVFDADVNISGLLNLLHAYDGKDLPYVAFFSTGGAIYGEQDEFPAPETHANKPTSPYGLSKQVSELYLDLWNRIYGLNYSVLRLANVYGPRQIPKGEAAVVAIFTGRLLKGEPCTIYGTGDQTRDYVYVGDVADAFFKAVSTKAVGIYNIGTGIETSVNELYSEICESLEVSSEPQYAEHRPGDQFRSCIDASLAKEGLGWEPSLSLKEGLKQTAEWNRSNLA